MCAIHSTNLPEPKKHAALPDVLAALLRTKDLKYAVSLRLVVHIPLCTFATSPNMRSRSLLISISPRVSPVELRAEIQIPHRPNLIDRLTLHLRDLARRPPASLVRAPFITLPRLRHYARVDDVVECVHAVALARHIHFVGVVDHDAAVVVVAAAVDSRPGVSARIGRLCR